MANIILAPHPDDEVIGCYSALVAGDIDYVYYFFDLTEQRRAEAEAAGAYFNFTPQFVDGDFPEGITDEDVLWVPSIRDSHPHHRSVNLTFRAAAKRFYSVEFSKRKRLLDEVERVEKRRVLDLLYPSQKELWESNASYYLFEEVAAKDYDTYQTFQTLLAGKPIQVETNGLPVRPEEGDDIDLYVARLLHNGASSLTIMHEKGRLTI